MLEASSDTRDITQQIAWFIRLRFVAVVGMVGSATTAQVLGLVADTTPLYTLAGITLALNGLYAWYAGRLRGGSYERVRRHADVQIGLDLLILTAVLHFSGGSENPLAFFFLFHTFIAAQMVSVRTGLVVAVTSVVLVGGLGVLELTGWLAPPADGLRLVDLHALGLVGLACWLGVLGLTLGISVYFVATALRQVRTRDEELGRLNLQLGQSEKLASVGTLAAGVAHEINNPVGVIRTKAQILRYRIEDGDDPASVLAELDTIEKHADRISAITKGLLTFSKESAFELSLLDLNRLADEAAELVRVPFEEGAVSLRVHPAPGPIRVMGSENHLLQVLVNILLNARDASPTEASVTLGVSSDGHMACLSIQDEGEGIAPGNLAKIFDPFYTTKEVDRGTGLGLAVSHGIVERHRGTITVESEVGRGTGFEILLPLGAS